jgi:hypothetical protein
MLELKPLDPLVLKQSLRHLGYRQHPIHHSGLNRRARHPFVLRLTRILCDSESAILFDPLDADGSVAI